MREALFILAVLAVILLLTALRYRKQIAGAIGIAKALKDARLPKPMSGERSAGTLVQCARCGIRLPEANAVRLPGDSYRCDRECSKVKTA